MSKPEVKTPVITTLDLTTVLAKLAVQAVNGVADVTIKLGSKNLIIYDIAWDDMGEEIQILTYEAE